LALELAQLVVAVLLQQEPLLLFFQLKEIPLPPHPLSFFSEQRVF
jgi:hypothetical protein